MPQALSKTKLSFYRSFLQKKTRESEGKFLIEGWHLLEEALKSERAIYALVYCENARREADEERALALAIEQSNEVFLATESQMIQISDTKTPQGVIALIEKVSTDFESLIASFSEEGPLRVVALDGLGDPGNCGSILRTCAWFGMDAVLLGSGCAELESGKTVRSSMGGIFHLPIAVKVDLPLALRKLREMGALILTTELDGAKSLKGFGFPERAILVVGSEARGVSDEVSALADERLFIPRMGRGESLNAAGAAAVFLSYWRI